MDRQVEVKATGIDLRDVQRQMGASDRQVWLTVHISSASIELDIPPRFSECFFITLNDLDGSVIRKEIPSGRELIEFITPLIERQIKSSAEFKFRTNQQRLEYLQAEMEGVNKTIASAMEKRDKLRKEVSALGKETKGKR